MRRLYIAAIGLSLIVIFCLALSYAGPKGDEPIKESGSIMTRTPLCKLPSLAKITWMDAMNTALKKTPGGILEVELEDEDGYLVFSVEVVTADKKIMEYCIDAGNGEILCSEEEECKCKEDEEKSEMKAGSIKVSSCKLDYPSMAKIKPEDAVKTAANAVDGKFLSLALEGDDGILVYEVTFTHTCKSVMEVEIDAGTGKILEMEEEKCCKKED